MQFTEIKEPVKGEPIKAEWGRDVARFLRSLTPSAGPGIKITRTHNGTIYTADAEGGKKKTKYESDTVIPGIVTGAGDGFLLVDLYENGLIEPVTKSQVKVYAVESARSTAVRTGTVILVHKMDGIITAGGIVE